MSEISEIIDELKRIHDGDAWHGPSFQEATEGITAVQAAAKPLPNAHSIWELVLHMAGWEEVWNQRLKGNPTDEPENGDFPSATDITDKEWANALEHVNSVHRNFIETVSQLSDKNLDENVSGKDCSIRFMLREAVRHHVYHTGQIALLKKAS